MIPKVATHILHTTSRAAAAVHNQTSTLRNVFQLQTSSGTSTAAGTPNIGPWNGTGSSSRGNSNGPGPGGSKQNTGSRFYAGFTGPVRSVTQANAVTSQDGTFVQHDDSQEEQAVPARRVSPRASKGHRIRSSSLSMSRVETLGVLKTVQIHARSRHAFAHSQSGNDTAKTPRTTVPRKSIQHSRRLITRRNSTSSHISDSKPINRNAASDTSDISSVDPASIPLPPSPSASTTDLFSDLPTSQPNERVPEQNPDNLPPVQESPAFTALKIAYESGDPAVVADAVHHFRQTLETPTAREFNMALSAVLKTRRPSEPLTLMMDIYYDLVRCQVAPTINTYDILLRALAKRDLHVQRFIQATRARLSRYTFIGLTNESNPCVLEESQKLAAVKLENNFAQALSLLETVLGILGMHRRPATFDSTLMTVLHACALHGEVNQATHLFSLLEKSPHVKPPASAYRFLMQAYANAGDIQNAERVFDEFRAISRDNPESLRWPYAKVDNKKETLLVWNQMIEGYFQAKMPDKAVGLVEEMLNSSTNSSDVPYPSSLTYTSILNGFCSSGDVETAIVWFKKLLEQPQASSDPLLQTKTPIRPDEAAWDIMIEAMARGGMVSELNAAFQQMPEDIGPTIEHRSMVLFANLRQATAGQKLTFLMDKVLPTTGGDFDLRKYLFRSLEKWCIAHGMFEMGARAMILLVETALLQANHHRGKSAEGLIAHAKSHFLSFCALLNERTLGNLPFDLVLRLWRFGEKIGCNSSFSESQIPFILRSYKLTQKAGTLPQDIRLNEWITLLKSLVQFRAATMEGNWSMYQYVPSQSFPGFVALVDDMEASGFKLAQLEEELINKILRVVFFQSGTEDLNALLSRLGPEYNRTVEELQDADLNTRVSEDQVAQAPSPTLSPELESAGAFPFPSPQDRAATELFISPDLSWSLESLIRRSAEPATLSSAYARVMDGISAGQIPKFSVIAFLIEKLGRVRHLKLMRKTYIAAHGAINMISDIELARKAWFQIENGMIIGLAHAGEAEAAHAHRKRMLDNNGAPSADAYGILIHTVKDTTDDTSNAMALFEEAMRLEVPPNLYLYNTVLSKLSKARKADYAVKLFQEMSSRGIRPSSVTYSVVIGACARVGDVLSAESLFAEMELAHKFKPQIPPYNMMMQLYTTTKRNRNKALFFFQKMKNANIPPTAYTYKLLLDTYGTLEPVDIKAMEHVFSTLERDESVPVQSSHFASLIHAYGCVLKDLPKAISIFDSIESHPRASPPDAVAYEAIINTLVAHKRTDLIPEYVNRMNVQGVKMTAYVANFLIKGYANGGDLQEARATFERLADPAEGVAASGNHAPHDSAGAGAPSATGTQGSSDPQTPVYREPSTWEAMVRAELGAGERERATNLLERLKARKYPEAVYNRISGIMIDHSLIL